MHSVVERLGQAADTSCDDRPASRHRLTRDEREAVEPRRHDDKIHLREGARQVTRGGSQIEAVSHAELDDLPSQIGLARTVAV